MGRSPAAHGGLTAVGAALLLAGCGISAPTPPPGPFTLSVVNAARNEATVTWTGPRQGGGFVDACTIGEFTFDDGFWIVALSGAFDAARFPMQVATANDGPRGRTVAIDAFGRIDVNARVPLDEPPCVIE